MNTTYIPHSVTLADVAKATKRTTSEIQDECVELAVFIGRDWCGRVAVAEVDAEQLVSGEARRAREDAAVWQAFLARCATWTAARDQAVQDAHDAVRRYSERDAKPADLLDKARDLLAGAPEMTGREEHADGVRSWPFPSSWGVPRGEAGSEERAGWVLNQVLRHVLARKLTSEPDLREAYLARKRVGP